MNPPFEPQILGLLCNWCCYAGADLAGVSRFQYPPNIRIIRVMCSGRVDALFVLDAFSRGIDGVLVGGCHPGDCHYGTGNYEAIHMINMTRMLLEYIGIDPHRVRLEWVSAAEGVRFAHIVSEFTEQVRALGPLGSEQGVRAEAPRRLDRARRGLSSAKSQPEGEELEGLQLRLDAAKIAAGGEKLRWIVGKSTEFLREGNKYGEVFTRHELNRAMERIVADEVAAEEILLLLQQEPLSVRKLSQRLELPPPQVLKYITALRRKGLVRLEGIRGASPLYAYESGGATSDG